MVLTVTGDQPPEERFHTVGRGTETPGRNYAEQLCTLPPVAKALPQSSKGRHTQAVSEEGPQQFAFVALANEFCSTSIRHL